MRTLFKALAALTPSGVIVAAALSGASMHGVFIALFAVGVVGAAFVFALSLSRVAATAAALDLEMRRHRRIDIPDEQVDAEFAALTSDWGAR